MKHFLGLIPIYARVHKKQNRMTKICISLAVFLVTAIFSMAEMEVRSQYLQTINSDGNWHAMYKDLDEKQAKMVAARPEVNAAAWYDVLNYSLEEAYEIQEEKLVICGISEAFFEIMPSAKLSEGHFPVSDREVILTQNAKEKFGAEIGSELTVSLPDGRKEKVTVAGFTGNASMLMKDDAIGLFTNINSFSLFTQEKETLHHVFYVQYKKTCNINNVIDDTARKMGLSTEQVGKNTKLLATMGMSRDSYMLQLYGVAAVLAVLVITAGILMITSNLNSNVARRTEFFGLMSCLGATRKQISHFVRLEALNWCKTAVPIGIGGGIVITWILCAMLRLSSPQYFAQMPAVGISIPGCIFGTVIGVLTVLIAAAAPARRAASVSPLTAVSGNTGSMQAVRKGAGHGHLGIEASLGVYHAVASRKNLFLMVGSFAFSIILFLAFTTAIDFMNHALTPLQPYTPDISIISQENLCEITVETLQEIEQKPFVKRAYGRMFAYELPVVANGREMKVNLISYEKNQFGWAEKALSDGATEAVVNGNEVLTVFDMANPLKTGDVLELKADGERVKETEQAGSMLKIAGVLEKCPFSRDNEAETIICSEDTFCQLTGERAYTILDIQLKNTATDADVAELRKLAGNLTFSDQRQSNREIRAAFYSFAIFVYGFLLIIALISVFNIINSIAMSVSSRISQYGTMRAIGMSDKQVIKMVAVEACTYGFLGIVAGLILGLPLNRFLFQQMITVRWGDAWYVPFGAMLVIMSVVAGAVILSVMEPTRRIREMTIVDTIHGE